EEKVIAVSRLASGRSGYRWVVLGAGLLGWAGVLAADGQAPPAAPTTGAAGATASPAPAPDPAVLAEGQAMFRGLCSGCHGGAGRGGKGPDLTDTRWIHGGTDDDIARVIQNGVPKTTMKKLGDALKPDQVRKLILFIRSLAR